MRARRKNKCFINFYWFKKEQSYLFLRKERRRRSLLIKILFLSIKCVGCTNFSVSKSFLNSGDQKYVEIAWFCV